MKSLKRRVLWHGNRVFKIEMNGKQGSEQVNEEKLAERSLKQQQQVNSGEEKSLCSCKLVVVWA